MRDRTLLLLANGTWGDADGLKHLVEHASGVIAADGAWAKATSLGVSVDLVVGDLDSLDPEERAQLLDSGVEVDIHSPEKDATDLELAVDHALEMSPTKLVVFGAFGGRIDQTLANIFLLEKAVEAGVEVELHGPREAAWLVSDELTLQGAKIGDRLSLLPLSPHVRVWTEGLRYPLADEVLLRAGSRGVSNEVCALPVRVRVRDGLLFVVHAPASWEGAS